ncbi:guanylate kinase [Lutibaculum baratangense]|uniref:Guanylate kinase n=1 Tax=Lutibaculum baratangense AMV1 TaxID=631454 RepID=V4RW17_9HYPH|nr:guanylate kinase [Lutibaculum baratangense]ESR27230.1 Guanylate kinase [Lutibaculum baratangense AMV1]
MPEPTPGDSPRRGLILVLSSPSGAGKTSIARALLAQEAESGHRIDLSISVTTRSRRPSEVDGIHYHFRSVRQFETMRDRGELLEWAEVHGNWYGTPLEPVEAALRAGEDVLFDIDWQGTRQVAQAMPEDVVTVFILPPSLAELRSRLERRAEDSPEVIARRLENAREEIGHWREYGYLVINRDLEVSVEAVRSILHAERHRQERQKPAQILADELISGL